MPTPLLTSLLLASRIPGRVHVSFLHHPAFQIQIGRVIDSYLRSHLYATGISIDVPETQLCPALFRYFEQAPAELYVQIKPKAS